MEKKQKTNEDFKFGAVERHQAYKLGQLFLEFETQLQKMRKKLDTILNM